MNITEFYKLLSSSGSTVVSAEDYNLASEARTR